MPEVRDRIESFLAEKRIAVVGVSRNPNDFNTKLFLELLSRGYDAIPVNPHANTIAGRPCFARVQDIRPPVPAALLMTRPGVTEQAVRDCAEAGVKKVWMYRASGSGAVSPAAIRFCDEKGIEVVPGECPHMFLPNAAWPHRIHAAVLKILGKYPK